MDPYATTYYSDGAIENDRQEVGPVKRFFFACAGAYIKILEVTPSEHTKYVGIGATIFLTACLAVISGSFAIYTLVENAFVAFLFGLLWGALIFNLDRYIVSSIRKEGRTWHELGLAMPRMILAVLISIVITKPIEVRLFSNQINSELLAYTAELEREAEATLDAKLGLDDLRVQLHVVDSARQNFKRQKEGKPTSFDFGEVSAEYMVVKREYDSLHKVYTPRIEANEARRNYLWTKYATKVYKTNEKGEKVFERWDFPKKWLDKTNQLYNLNKRLKRELETKLAVVKGLEQKRKGARDEFAKSMEEEIGLLNDRRNTLADEIARKEELRKVELPLALEKAKKYGKGFPAQIQVLERMKEDDSSIWWMSNLIVLLFIMLETSPVFVKLITKRGPYDYLLSRIEHHKKVESLRYISDMNYDLNATMRLQARKNQNGEKVNGVQHGEEVYAD
ncbi:MAG: DUF4407 domain-containing protein [Bacteroidota bacterium]